jgi:hypothetical protein
MPLELHILLSKTKPIPLGLYLTTSSKVQVCKVKYLIAFVHSQLCLRISITGNVVNLVQCRKHLRFDRRASHGGRFDQLFPRRLALGGNDVARGRGVLDKRTERMRQSRARSAKTIQHLDSGNKLVNLEKMPDSIPGL